MATAMASVIRHPLRISSLKPNVAPHSPNWKPFRIFPSCRTSRRNLSLSASSSKDDNRELNESEVMQDNVTLTLLTQMVEEYDKFDMSQSATEVIFKLFQEAILEGGIPCRSTCEQLIIRLYRLGCLANMQYVLNVMSEPSLKAFSFAISAYTAEGMAYDALKVFIKMKVAGVTPTLSIYRNLIRGQCEHGSMKNAIILVQCMLTEPSLSVLDYMTFVYLMYGFLKRKMVADANFIFKQIESNEWTPDAMHFTALIKGLFQEGKMDEALKLIETMHPHGVEPDETYIPNIEGLFKSSKMEETIKLPEEMRKKGFHPRNRWLNLIIDRYCEEGRMQEAVKLVEERIKLLEEMRGCAVSGGAIEASTLDHWFWKMTLIRGFCKQGSMEEAIKILQEMRESGLQPDTEVLNTILDGYRTQGRMEEAIKFLEEMSGI